MVGYVYIVESFDTLFNMGYGEGAYNAPPPPKVMGRKIRPWLRWLSILVDYYIVDFKANKKSKMECNNFSVRD